MNCLLPTPNELCAVRFAPPHRSRSKSWESNQVQREPQNQPASQTAGKETTKVRPGTRHHSNHTSIKRVIRQYPIWLEGAPQRIPSSGILSHAGFIKGFVDLEQPPNKRFKPTYLPPLRAVRYAA